MSVNQSKGDKNEPQQYRRVGRSGNSSLPRNYSGGGGKGGGGGGGGGSNTAPPSSSSYSSQRSFKKTNNHAQGVQPRVNTPITNSNSDLSNSSTPGGASVTNGAHLQPPARGAPGAPSTGATPKPSETPIQKNTNTPGLPKAPPQGNTAVPSSDVTGPSTPTKGPADASRAFQLQFGSISPGIMNVMQIPARTSSAPPNFDEQKQAQARVDSLKANKLPTPSIPKQRKDDVSVSVSVVQSNAPEIHHSIPKPKKKTKLYLPILPLKSCQVHQSLVFQCKCHFTILQYTSLTLLQIPKCNHKECQICPSQCPYQWGIHHNKYS